MYVRRAHLHRVLLHRQTRAEEVPAAVAAITGTATQAALPAEAVPLLREARLQAQAVAQVAATVAEAADRVQAPQATAPVQAATALVAVEAVAVVAVEEDNFLPASGI